MRFTETILSVSQLTRAVKSVIEAGFERVLVEGEISNCKRHTSGHLYLTLKDDSAQIQCVMWRSRAQNLFFSPQDGMKVLARGRLTVYEARGQYQMDLADLQPRGVGDLQIAFEQLRRKLAGEGLFDTAHKRPLPRYPGRIGIVTSPTGAVIRDMLSIIARRFPAVEIILAPVNVQGAGAANEIAEAIGDLNRLGGIDVMIVGRGGGSLEDLWAFNEELVARAIYGSRIPVISAVGHEVDFTIADYVADLRAPTPSAAAELVVPNSADLLENVHGFEYTMRQSVLSLLSDYRDRVRSLVGSYSFNRPFDRLREYSQRSDELLQRLSRVAVHTLETRTGEVASLRRQLSALNPGAVLARGYTMVLKRGAIVSRAAMLRPTERVELKFHDGIVPAEVLKDGSSGEIV